MGVTNAHFQHWTGDFNAACLTGQIKVCLRVSRNAIPPCPPALLRSWPQAAHHLLGSPNDFQRQLLRRPWTRPRQKRAAPRRLRMLHRQTTPHHRLILSSDCLNAGGLIISSSLRNAVASTELFWRSISAPSPLPPCWWTKFRAAVAYHAAAFFLLIAGLISSLSCDIVPVAGRAICLLSKSA